MPPNSSRNEAYSFITFYHQRPEKLDERDVEAYLTHLAKNKRVAAATQNLAFSAILYFYRELLGIDNEQNSIQAR